MPKASDKKAVYAAKVKAFQAAQKAANEPMAKAALPGAEWAPDEESLGMAPEDITLKGSAWKVPTTTNANGVERSAINVRYQMTPTGIAFHVDLTTPGFVLPATPGKPRTRANLGTTRGGMRLGSEALGAILQLNLQRALTPEEKAATEADSNAS